MESRFTKVYHQQRCSHPTSKNVKLQSRIPPNECNALILVGLSLRIWWRCTDVDALAVVTVGKGLGNLLEIFEQDTLAWCRSLEGWVKVWGMPSTVKGNALPHNPFPKHRYSTFSDTLALSSVFESCREILEV